MEREGGVCGRFEELEPETFLEVPVSAQRSDSGRGEVSSHKESNLSMSACEYAAPTTRLDSRVVFLEPFAGEALRQKGAVEL